MKGLFGKLSNELMKNLPKLDPKMMIAGTAIVVVGVGAFAFGTYRGHSVETAQTEVTEAKAEKEKTEKKGKDGKTESKGDEKRAPAGEHAPKLDPKKIQDKVPVDEDDDGYEEEVDVQIAHPKERADNRGAFTRLVDTYADAFQSVNDKVRAIYRAEEENRKLKLENAYLRVMVESQKFSCRADESKKKTETVGKKLATAAGSKAARSLASIRYQFPENLLPEQLHALGVSYFKAKDDEKAAVILNFLVSLEDDNTFKTPENYLMAGVALYRLENFKSAQDYFDKIEKMNGSDEETAKAKRQASYWNALVADRLHEGRRAQKIILENLEKDPHTKEARWVNPKGIGPHGKHETKRVPAAEHSDKDSHHEEKATD